MSSTARRLTVTDPDRKLLREVYDGTQEYVSKDVMPSMPIAELRPNDVVLAECMFVRKEVLGGWQSAFHLTGIVQLQRFKEPDADSGEGMEGAIKFPWRL